MAQQTQGSFDKHRACGFLKRVPARRSLVVPATTDGEPLYTAGLPAFTLERRSSQFRSDSWKPSNSPSCSASAAACIASMR